MNVPSVLSVVPGLFLVQMRQTKDVPMCSTLSFCRQEANMVKTPRYLWTHGEHEEQWERFPLSRDYAFPVDD